MAKRRAAVTGETADKPNGADAAARAKGFVEHQKDFKAAGLVLIDSFRPRHQPYKVEEWLAPSRKLHIVKVYDDGRMVRYEEAASHTDATDAAGAMK